MTAAPDGGTLFQRACAGVRGERTPVWIMRQAGRYLPEYRKLRESVDFLTATKTPDVAARITLLPMERFDLDAAILFSDIMTPLEGMGVKVEFAPGPVVAEPVRAASDVAKLRALDPDEGTPFVLEALGLVRRALDPGASLIGFAGAPFTLFCYLVEGGGSKDFMTARSFLRSEPKAAGDLLALLGESMTRYLIGQARAGADALMLFDSWAGLLAPAEYRRSVLPVVKELVGRIRTDTGRPAIYYVNGCATLLDAMREVGADVLGVDWAIPLASAVEALGPDVVVQGNLDPAALFAERAELDREVGAVLEGGRGAAAHIFNLGHGIHRATDPDQVGFLLERVRERSERAAAASPSG